MDTDPHGQPFNVRFNRARRAERDLCEMLGLVKGILADEFLADQEIRFLANWVSHHPDGVEQWTVNVVKQRLDRILADGRIDEDERGDLTGLLEAIVGGTAGIIQGDDASTQLPLDNPFPQFAWTSSVFVFTGKFAYGTRKDCEREVVRCSGVCEDSITMRTKYLIIGTFGSRDWVHTPFGRKIEKAVRCRDQGKTGHLQTAV